jgi:hypothetical protein
MARREAFTKAQFLSELDDLGEDRVRELLVSARHDDKLSLIEAWLRQREGSRLETSSKEHLELTRAAVNHALAANVRATLALAVSAIALLVAVLEGIWLWLGAH